MGMQINIGDHTSSEAGYIAIPNHRRDSMRWARTKARWIANNLPAANTYYRGLPNGQTLSQLLDDATIWINYHPTMTYYGETNAVGGHEVAISETSFKIGRWTVLATLVHELAHVNGAPGGTDQSAERAVLACGLGKASELSSGVDDPATPFNPRIRG